MCAGRVKGARLNDAPPDAAGVGVGGVGDNVGEFYLISCKGAKLKTREELVSMIHVHQKPVLMIFITCCETDVYWCS